MTWAFKDMSTFRMRFQHIFHTNIPSGFMVEIDQYRTTTKHNSTHTFLLGCAVTSGVGLLKLCSLISPWWAFFFNLWKYLLYPSNHVHIWQVPQQLSCGDTVSNSNVITEKTTPLICQIVFLYYIEVMTPVIYYNYTGSQWDKFGEISTILSRYWNSAPWCTCAMLKIYIATIK